MYQAQTTVNQYFVLQNFHTKNFVHFNFCTVHMALESGLMETPVMN